MSSYTKIQPHWVSKATDICSDGDRVFIIRSDLKHYMVTSHLNKRKNIAVHDLHPACQGGDHYLANYKGFYIIKGDSFRFVTNLTTDKDSKELSLHQNCRGGIHYFSFEKSSASTLFSQLMFVIIYSGGQAKMVSNLETDERAEHFTLSDDCKGGLYYWSKPMFSLFSRMRPIYFPHFYFLKPEGKWAAEYHFTTNLKNNERAKILSVCPDITPFLPGGLAVGKGPSYGGWELLQFCKNRSETTFQWKQSIKRHVDVKKIESESIEKHWSVKVRATCGLTASISQLHFSTEASHGKIERQTSQEEWTDSTEESREVSCDIEPGKTVYVWQYRFGFGNKPFLFTPYTMATSSSDPPTDIPRPFTGN